MALLLLSAEVITTTEDPDGSVTREEEDDDNFMRTPTQGRGPVRIRDRDGGWVRAALPFPDLLFTLSPLFFPMFASSLLLHILSYSFSPSFLSPSSSHKRLFFSLRSLFLPLMSTISLPLSSSFTSSPLPICTLPPSPMHPLSLLGILSVSPLLLLLLTPHVPTFTIEEGTVQISSPAANHEPDAE